MPELINGLHSHIPDVFLKDNVISRSAPPQMETKEVEMVEAKIIIYQGKDLCPTNKILGSRMIATKSDPYCKVRFMPRGQRNLCAESVLYLGKTSVVKDTVDPVWGNKKSSGEVFSAAVPLADVVQEEAGFEIRIWDKDYESKDDPMGLVWVPIYNKNRAGGDLMENQKKDWYDVQPVAGLEDTGEGMIQCALKVTQTVQEITEKVGGGPQELEQHYFGIKIRIIQAEGLPLTDKNLFGQDVEGDPYVIVRLMKDPHHDTKGVLLGKTEWLDDTTNPVWNESFNTKVPIDELDHHAYFLLRIKDRNDDTKDDPLGRVKVSMEELRHIINPTDNKVVNFTKWYNIPKDKTTPYATGKIQVKVTLSLLLAGSNNNNEERMMRDLSPKRGDSRAATTSRVSSSSKSKMKKKKKENNFFEDMALFGEFVKNLFLPPRNQQQQNAGRGGQLVKKEGPSCIIL